MIELPDIKRKKPKAPYRKPEAVKQLEALADAEARLKHPTCPHLAPRTYSDKTANGLTSCVIDFLRLSGCQAERISCAGRYVDTTKIITDTLGRKMKIGSGTWLPSSMQRGTADISAVIRGKSVKIEIKIGADRQSEVQKKYQAQVEQAGGIYLIIKTFEEFHNQFLFINNLNFIKMNKDYSSVALYAEEASSYTPAPAGPFLARCVSLIQLGTQKQEFQGIPGKDRMKIIVGWELPEELHVFDPAKGPQPFFVQQTYSMVLGEKATFSIHFQSWTGRWIDNKFNPLSMLGEPCLVNISHTPSTKDPSRMNAKITSVTRLTKNQICPPQISPFKVLVFAQWDQRIFDSLSDWTKKTIEASPEFKKMPFKTEGAFTKQEKPVMAYVEPEVEIEIDPLPF